MRTLLVLTELAAASLGCAAAAQPIPLEWNLRPQVVEIFQDLGAGENGSLAFVADSIGFARNSLNWFVRDRFWADYGIGGDGYMATGKGFAGSLHGPRAGLFHKATPTGVVLATAAGVRGPWGYHTPDGIFARISQTGSLELRLYGPECRLHYLTQPGGGILRVTLNGQVLVDAPTDGALAHASIEFPTGGGPYTLSTVTLSSADGGVVQTCGIDMRTGLPGYTQHRMARGGAGPRDFIKSNTPQTAAILAEVDPDVLIVMLDWVGENPQKEMATFIQDTNQLLDFYQQTLPQARFILMSHHPFKDNIQQEAAWLYEIARDRDIGFINLYDTVPGGFDEMNALGYMADAVHLTPAGGSFFGNYIYGLLKHAGACLPPAIDAPPQDQTVLQWLPVLFTVASPDAESYQWRKDGVDLPGAIQDTFTIDAAAPADAGAYDVVLANGCDITVSPAAILTVLPDADGDGFPADEDCDDTDPLVNPDATEVCDGADNNCDGQIDEGSAPVITQDPQPQSVEAGGTATFAVAAAGAQSYQWQRNGVDLPGATDPVYEIVSVRSFDAGTYRAVVSNPCGSATSAGAVLTVLPPTPPAAPSNLGGFEAPKGTVSLTWTDNATTETGYQVWREKRIANVWKLGAVVAALPPDAVSYSEAPGVGIWRYRVQAVKGFTGSGWTPYAPIPPAKPTALKAVNAGGSASITWTDTSNFETTFTPQRQKFAGTWGAAVTLPPLGADAQSLLDSPGPGKYRYRIRCSSPVGSSAWTTWATVTLP